MNGFLAGFAVAGVGFLLLAYAIHWAHVRDRERISAAFCALLDEANGRRWETEAEAIEANRRAEIAELVVDQLTADLAREHRMANVVELGKRGRR